MNKYSTVHPLHPLFAVDEIFEHRQAERWANRRWGKNPWRACRSEKNASMDQYSIRRTKVRSDSPQNDESTYVCST